VRTELYVGDVLIDSIAHEVQVLDARVPDRGEFLTVQGNQFLRAGQPWNPVGVNYWPHYIAGMDAQDFGAGWLRTGYYDPELVEGDLVRMEKLGSIWSAFRPPNCHIIAICSTSSNVAVGMTCW
jgi:hypothetical protein